MKKSKTVRRRQSIDWNHVTPFSKTIAAIIFIALPFIAFVMGMKYQEQLMSITHVPYEEYLEKLKINKSDVNSSETETISWQAAQELVLTCRVKMTAETHGGILNLTLQDDSVKLVERYDQSDLYTLINNANVNCGQKIIVGIE